MAIIKRPVRTGPSSLPPVNNLVVVRKPIRRIESGKAFVLPPSIILPDDDRTDYRKVVQRYADKVKNPKSAIRAKCVECSGGSLKEVQMCTVKSCALHPFRLGENPFHKKTRERLAAESGEEEADDDDDEESNHDEEQT